MQVKKIDHINIVVQDLNSATSFFTELGFVILQRGKLKGRWLDKLVDLKDVKAEYVALNIPNTQTNLELIKYDFPIGDKDSRISIPNQIGLRHFAIEVNDIERTVAELKNKGIKFFSEIQTYNINKKLCYLLGPEGIIIELAEYK